jgi:hypothetical protein
VFFLTQNVSFAHLDLVSRRTTAYYDEEYCDYDYSKAETKKKSEEHDLSELVKAWEICQKVRCIFYTVPIEIK